LQLFASLHEARGGQYVSIMVEAIGDLSADEMESVAAWYAR
jgi:hypothetical protein